MNMLFVAVYVTVCKMWLHHSICLSAIVILLFYSKAESVSVTEKNFVNTRNWIAGWETMCADSIIQTIVVPNVKTCKAYLGSCDGCHIAGFNVRNRECHLMSASPPSVIRTSSTTREHLCGEHKPVKITVECPQIHLENGNVSTPTEGQKHRNGERAILTCDLGYNLTGRASLTCLDNMSWDGLPSNCSVVECPPLATPDNGNVTSTNGSLRFIYAETSNFTCDIGYFVNGSNLLTCLANGTWDHVAPNCPRVECPLLTAPDNGNMTSPNGGPRFKYTDIANFTCDIGYFLNGSNTTTCLANANWDEVSPTCSAVPCPLTTAPIYGSASAPSNGLLHTFGETVTFTCGYGYSLTGSATLICLANGSWDGVLPTCSFLNIYPHNDLASCKDSQQGVTYEGTLAVAVTGKPCLKWMDATGSELTWLNNRIQKFPESTLPDIVNYCRNPDEWSSGPWCYTTWPDTFKACDVPSCPCQLPYMEFNGKCVVRYTQSGLTWKDASARCSGEGASLITYQHMSIPHIASFATRGCSSTFIALGAQKGSDSRWRFTDGTLIENIPWGSTQPNTWPADRLMLGLAGWVHDVTYDTETRIGCIICMKNTS